jgi:hypothetical protein
VYKTVDGGVHWFSVLDGLVPSFYPGFMAIAPSRPSTLYLMDPASGLLKTVDGGATWSTMLDVKSGVAPYAPPFFVDPSNDAVIYATPSVRPPKANVLFKSTDGAAHWRGLSFRPLLQRITSVVVEPRAPTLYASYLDADGAVTGIMKSADSGETWAAIDGTLDHAHVWKLALDANVPAGLYAATDRGIFHSRDGGANWLRLRAGLPSAETFQLTVDAGGTLVRAATAAGMFEHRLDRTSLVVEAIEYYNAGLDHYFMTANRDEIALLDATDTGWSRTGLRFNVYPAGASVATPTCRFSTMASAIPASRFYSPFVAECLQVQASVGWQLETADAFEVELPSADGTCSPRTAPVYRLFNNLQGGGPNHRYTTDRVTRTAMLAKGWIAEGFGDDGVSMCAPF